MKYDNIIFTNFKAFQFAEKVQLFGALAAWGGTVIFVLGKAIQASVCDSYVPGPAPGSEEKFERAHQMFYHEAHR